MEEERRPLSEPSTPLGQGHPPGSPATPNLSPPGLWGIAPLNTGLLSLTPTSPRWPRPGASACGHRMGAWGCTPVGRKGPSAGWQAGERQAQLSWASVPPPRSSHFGTVTAVRPRTLAQPGHHSRGTWNPTPGLPGLLLTPEFPPGSQEPGVPGALSLGRTGHWGGASWFPDVTSRSGVSWHLS